MEVTPEMFKAFLTSARTTKAGNTEDYETGFYEGFIAGAASIDRREIIERAFNKSEKLQNVLMGDRSRQKAIEELLADLEKGRLI